MDMTRPWSDVPADILILVINKLRFHDQIQALAVCKNWRVSKDYVTRWEYLPCVARHSQWLSILKDRYSFEYKLFDPNSQKVHDVWDRISMNPNCWDLYTLASKHGWLLFGSKQGKSLYLHNPFTNDMRLLSKCFENEKLSSRAAIKGNPRSPKCEIFIVDIRENHYLHIETYKSCGRKLEIVVGVVPRMLTSVVYMNQKIHCLFKCGSLYSYSLEDKSWKFIASKFPGLFVERLIFIGTRKCWLLEMKENLIIVILNISEAVGNIFRFDWSEMSWTKETNLKYTIYISGNVAFAGPLTDCYGEKLEDCRVFHYEDEEGVQCYTMSKEGRLENFGNPIPPENKDYNWTRRFWLRESSFIEPPYFGS